MEYTELQVTVKHTTDEAVLVVLLEFDGDEQWIPWSCIEDNGEDFKRGYNGRMYVAEWFAQREGLL